MNLRNLRYFVSVMDHGSFHSASQRLGIAQPALSRRIQDLEAALGCNLLDRSVRGVTPTQAGRVLHREALQILDKVADATTLVRDAGQSQNRELRLGLIQSARKYDFIRQALTELAKTQPGIRISTIIGSSAMLATDLRHGRLDASLLYEHRLDTALFAERLIHRERYILGMHPHHRLARPGPIALPDLTGEAFVWLPRGDDQKAHDPVLEHCRALGFTPMISQTARNQSELIDIVSTSGGLCITPISTVLTVSNNLLVFRSIPDFGLELDLYLSWNPKLRQGLSEPALSSIHAAIDKHQSDIAGGRCKWSSLDDSPQVRTH